MHGAQALDAVSFSAALGVVGLAGVLESGSFFNALRQVRIQAKDHGQSLYDYIVRGPDPMGVAVMVEDGAGVLGSVVAGVGITLSHLGIVPQGDAIASLCIGGMLASSSTFLWMRNRKALLGRPLPSPVVTNILRKLEARPSVVSCHCARSIFVGADQARVEVNVNMNPEYLARDVLRLRQDELWETRKRMMHTYLSERLTPDGLDDWQVNRVARYHVQLLRERDELSRIIQKELQPLQVDAIINFF
ncbi:MAG: hypothetical protein MHM6MM_007548 [Cercozoa sp. M6MM]